MTRNSGNRQRKPYSIEKTEQALELDPAVFSKYTVFRIVHDGQSGDIYISETDPPKVIGYTD